MTTTRYYLGIDVSTQGAKLVVLDYEKREAICTEAVQYDNDLKEFGTLNGAVGGRPQGVAESDPRMWLAAVDILLGRFAKSGLDGSLVRAINVSGQQHGLVALDAAGNLTRPYAKLWNDVSTVAQCQELTREMGGDEAMIAAVGNVQKPGYTAGKILHFKQEDPAAFARTTTFFLVHNYINFYLTGGVREMEPGDLSGMALWHPQRGQWSKRLLDVIDPALAQKLPPVQGSARFIGTIAPTLAARFGINPHCKIDAGSGDNMCGAIGTGNISPGVLTVSLGTSGTAYGFSDHFHASADGEVAGFADATGHFLPLVCVANLAVGYNHLLQMHQLTHEEFDQMASARPVGNRGRMLVPWFVGERTPDLPDAAACWFGFNLDDFTPQVMARAIVEGHVMNLYAAALKLPSAAQRIHLTGGLAKSRAFRQAIADFFGAEVVPVQGEGAALGAAMHAAWLDTGTDLATLLREVLVFDEALRERPNQHSQREAALARDLYLALATRLKRKEDGDLFAMRTSLAKS